MQKLMLEFCDATTFNFRDQAFYWPKLKKQKKMPYSA